MAELFSKTCKSYVAHVEADILILLINKAVKFHHFVVELDDHFHHTPVELTINLVHSTKYCVFLLEYRNLVEFSKINRLLIDPENKVM